MSQLAGPAQATILTRWLPKERLGLGLGLAVSGAAAGSICNPLWFEALEKTIGWRNTFRVISGISFVTALFASLAYVPKTNILPPVPSQKFCQRKLIPLLIGLPTIMLGYWVLFVFVAPFAREVLKMDDQSISILLVVIGGSNFVGRIGSGWLSDRFGALPVFFTSIFLKSILTSCFPLILHPAAFLIAMSAIGVVAGGLFGLVPKTIVEYFGERKLSVYFGLVFSCSAIGSMCGLPMIGALVETYGYFFGSCTAGLCLLTGDLIFFSLICFPNYKKSLSKHETQVLFKG